MFNARENQNNVLHLQMAKSLLFSCIATKVGMSGLKGYVRKRDEEEERIY